MSYTLPMETVVLVILALVVAVVAIDAIARLDERRPRKTKPRDESMVSTQKIVVDLTKRT
jgi:hypothetical protein